MAELDDFRDATREWLDANCPAEMRHPIRGEDDVYWGGRNASFSSDAQRSSGSRRAGTRATRCPIGRRRMAARA